MKNKHIIFQLLTLVCLLGSGCKKLVDAGEPLTTTTTDKVFTKDASAYAALSGLYSALLNSPSGNGESIFSNGGMTTLSGLSSDELSSFLGASVDESYRFSLNSLTSANAFVSGGFWTPMYKLIYNANSIIEGVEASTSNQLTPAARKQILAEAKFIRAFNYFYLVNLFGDVPLLTRTDWKSNSQLRRASADLVYQQIITDLTQAQQDLPADYAITGGERIRANRFVASALLARVYLFRRDWKNAEQQATSIIADGQFALEENLDNVFRSNSKESIWQLKPSVANAAFQFQDELNFTPQLWWADIPEDLRPLYLDESVYPDLLPLLYPVYYLSSQLSASFEKGDKRLEEWTSFIETPTYAPFTGITDRFPTKYKPILSGSKKYLTVFRLAEQLLIRAEARAELGDIAGAYTDVNTVRHRAGLDELSPGGKADALTSVAHERFTELFAEWGHRWFDLKRTGKAIEVLSKVPSKQISASGLLYPIPLSEIQSAPSLVQNPGYQ